LEGQRGEPLRHVLDLHVQAVCVQPEPPQAGVGRRPAELLLSDPGDRPVVEDLALLVAPRRIHDGVFPDLRGVAGDHPVDQPDGVGPANGVLEQR
jgi:hypothetical protein